jgi:lysine-N-methylase
MPRHDLDLPVFQNWSCHNCSGCCRQHQIEITAEERARIEKQNWTEKTGIPQGQPVFQSIGPWWDRRSALAHQPDGACVFLNEEGLCRIHAKFGEAAKPLACRVYPYAFHPAGKQVAVSLRFSCPSVVANLGRPLKDNKSELNKIAAFVVPDYAGELGPPRINAREKVDWADFRQFIAALDRTLSAPDFAMNAKLCQALSWLKLVETARFEKVQGARLKEFLELIILATQAETVASLTEECPPPVSKSGRLHFRMLVAQYARKDTATEVKAGWKGRIRLLKAALRFAKGKGNVPSLQSAFREVPFEAIENMPRQLPAGAEEIFTRYFRVKVQGLHFCGRAYYDFPLVAGFQSLALMYPVVIWLARWLAVGAGRGQITLEEISQALAIADHHHGYSPALGNRTARGRIRQLGQLDDISKHCRWYGYENTAVSPFAPLK